MSTQCFRSPSWGSVTPQASPFDLPYPPYSDSMPCNFLSTPDILISFSHLHQSQSLPGHHHLHLISPVVSRWSRCCFFVLYSLFSPYLLPPGTWRSLSKHTRSVLYGLSWAAHKVPQTGGLKRDIFISALETRTLKAGCRQGQQCIEDGPSLSPQRLVVAGNPWHPSHAL